MKAKTMLDTVHHETIQSIQALIDSHQRFWVTTHVHPDGDGLASMLIIKHLLEILGKQVIAVVDDKIPQKFDFLHGIHQIFTEFNTPLPFEAQIVLVLDASCIHRIGNVQNLLTNAMKIVNIDHHASNDAYGLINLIEGDASSTAEVAYHLFEQFSLPLTPQVATLIYTGIICDTGRFIFPNTSANALAICSKMVQHGAKPSEIAENIYFRSSQSTVLALSESLSHLEFHFSGKAASMLLSQHFLEQHDSVDTEGFVDHLLAIDGTEVEFFMVERQPKEYRVSFRSKNHVNVHSVANHFGGGGHQRAAGATLMGDADQVKERILDVLGNYLK